MKQVKNGFVLLICLFGLFMPLIVYTNLSFDKEGLAWYDYAQLILPHQLSLFLFDGVSIQALVSENRSLTFYANPYHTFFYLLGTVALVLHFIKPKWAQALVTFTYFFIGWSAFSTLLKLFLPLFFNADHFFKGFKEPLFWGYIAINLGWLFLAFFYVKNFAKSLSIVPHLQPVLQTFAPKVEENKRLSARELLEKQETYIEQTAFQRSGKGQRIFHLLLDLMLYFLLFSGTIKYFMRMINDKVTAEISWLIWLIVCRILYYFISEFLFGFTPAKLLTATCVVNQQGEKTNLGQIATRTLLRFVPFEAFTFLGKHGLHDKGSYTYVAKTEQKHNAIDVLLFTVIFMITLFSFILISFF